MNRLLAGVVVGCMLAAPAAAQAPAAFAGFSQSSGTTALLQAVSAVNDRVVWVSGHRATWARTTDGGATWHADSMTGPDTVLQFRDVHATSADRAWLLAAGPGERSRIYHTEDGGRHWTLQFANPDSSAFFDCFDFWDERRGIAVSDAVNGHLVVITTDDGGDHWRPVPDSALPAALPGEGAFAASGTCLVARHGGRAWIATGAEAGARVHATADYGRTWRVVETPIVHGPASGIASLAFLDDERGFAVGGRIADPKDSSVAFAITRDGGATWTAGPRLAFTGAAFGSALLRGPYAVLVAAGPGGLAAINADCILAPATETRPACAWERMQTAAFWAIGSYRNIAWAVGPSGRIDKMVFATLDELRRLH